MKSKYAYVVTFLLVITFSLAVVAQPPSGQAPTIPSDAAQNESGIGNTAAQTGPAPKGKAPDVIYVPTKDVVVEAMMKLARVSSDDVVYDLGCGDGRIVIAAAKKFGARKAVGIDIDPERIKESNENAKAAGVTDRVKFLQQDLFASDFSEASVVTLYLLSSLNEKLRPILMEQLKPGTRIVSHDFAMGDWQPEKKISVQADDREHMVYLWTVPAKRMAKTVK